MYGEDALGFQSVWSDDKDDVLLDNKTRDVMGLGAFAYNIISSKSPDDN